MMSEVPLIIVLCSLLGIVILCTCCKIYKNTLKIKNEKNTIQSMYNKLNRINIVTPINDKEELKDERYNNITSVEIRTVEHLV